MQVLEFLVSATKVDLSRFDEEAVRLSLAHYALQGANVDECRLFTLRVTILDSYQCE